MWQLWQNHWIVEVFAVFTTERTEDDSFVYYRGQQNDPTAHDFDRFTFFMVG